MGGGKFSLACASNNSMRECSALFAASWAIRSACHNVNGDRAQRPTMESRCACMAPQVRLSSRLGSMRARSDPRFDTREWSRDGRQFRASIVRYASCANRKIRRKFGSGKKDGTKIRISALARLNVSLAALRQRRVGRNLRSLGAPRSRPLISAAQTRLANTI